MNRCSGHPAADDREYETILVTRRWIDAVWSKWYDLKVVPGGTDDFQDMVILRPRRHSNTGTQGFR
jgi:hypothetical protein